MLFCAKNQFRKNYFLKTNFCENIIFVLDLTETCGFTIEAQLKLLRRLKEINKPTYIYLSKTDIYNEDPIYKKTENENTVFYYVYK